MNKNILASVFIFFSLLFANPAAFAQGNGNGNGNGGNGNSGNTNGPCNTSQPRPITGNQHPCPGSIETYCIDNDRNYTSFVWDVPRAHAGNPPTGWEIISGQGTNCVTVRVGTKSGTMKVKVQDPICGTKVATLPVKPAKGFLVDVAGPDSICVNVQQTYTATVFDSLGRGNGNGNGQVKGTFTYSWTVPAGWAIVSGQGTSSIDVTPGTTDGQVSVTATFVSSGNGNGNGNNGNGNNGNGVGNFKAYCNTTASDAIAVDVNNNCGTTPPPTCPITANITGPDTLCLFSDEPFIFTVNATAGATYVWTITNATITAGQGTDRIEVMADIDAGPGSVSVVVTTDCGSATTNMPFEVVEDCGNINPLPVELISFNGAATSEGIALNWATASELNNDRFEVQRSQDGRSFETIGTVMGKGTTTSRNDYKFVDKAAKNGLNYYRLRQVDLNGEFEFSKVVAIDAKAIKGAEVTLYPNPTADGEFNIRLTPTNEPVNILIMDISGKMLLNKTVTSSNELKINGSALGMKAGIYLISVKAGNSVTVEKLIVR